MSEYAGINVRLTREAFERLLELAQRELRTPRDQASYLLRAALVVDPNPTTQPNTPQPQPERATLVTP
jgi:hypothetical protein